MDLCKVEGTEAYQILQRLVDAGELVLVGKGKYAYYLKK